MKRNEINTLVAEAIEALIGTKAGSGTLEQRAESREIANEKCSKLPKNWWKKADPALVECFCQIGAQYA
jgi:hypothetical protein